MNEELPRDEHEMRIKNIVNATPTEYRKWLTYKLKYSNEPTLQKRLTHLLNKFNLSIETLIPNIDIFTKKVVDTRNYMNHHDLSLKGKTVSDKELFLITEKLRVLVETCLLYEIGFDYDEMKTLLLKRYQERFKVYEQ